ncbi:MAG: patatin-like phospholipase family protein [Elusimicrobiota bacterium]|nr:patatin-like phospholipase family protein [Elusimicrobiota bacterium]
MAYRIFLIIVFLSGWLHAFDTEDHLKILSSSRWKKNRAKVGIVLSGGAARGLAHVGVIKCWQEKKLPLDLVVGTSVGALVGVLYASGLDGAEIGRIVSGLNWNELIEFKVTPSRILNLTSVISSEKMGELLFAHLGKKRFSDLRIPFVCVACDIRTGEKIVFRDGELIPAVRASSCIPGIFEPVEYRHRVLVDGGVVDNVPTDIALDEGMDIIVASWTGGSRMLEDSRNILAVLTQVISVSGTVLSRQQLKRADVVIEPDLKDVSPLDLDKFAYSSAAGYDACRKKVDEIEKMFLQKTIEKLKEERNR